MLLGQVIEGSSESVTVTVNEQSAVFPEASVARYVTVLVPTGKVEPLESPAIRVTEAIEQLSEALAVL